FWNYPFLRRAGSRCGIGSLCRSLARHQRSAGQHRGGAGDWHSGDDLLRVLSRQSAETHFWIGSCFYPLFCSSLLSLRLTIGANSGIDRGRNIAWPAWQWFARATSFLCPYESSWSRAAASSRHSTRSAGGCAIVVIDFFPPDVECSAH